MMINQQVKYQIIGLDVDISALIRFPSPKLFADRLIQSINT